MSWLEVNYNIFHTFLIHFVLQLVECKQYEGGGYSLFTLLGCLEEFLAGSRCIILWLGSDVSPQSPCGLVSSLALLGGVESLRGGRSPGHLGYDLPQGGWWDAGFFLSYCFPVGIRWPVLFLLPPMICCLSIGSEATGSMDHGLTPLNLWANINLFSL